MQSLPGPHTCAHTHVHTTHTHYTHTLHTHTTHTHVHTHTTHARACTKAFDYCAGKVTLHGTHMYYSCSRRLDGGVA